MLLRVLSSVLCFPLACMLAVRIITMHNTPTSNTHAATRSASPLPWPNQCEQTRFDQCHNRHERHNVVGNSTPGHYCYIER
jgi:hypothetical protein